jgi:hypothetical protein
MSSVLNETVRPLASLKPLADELAQVTTPRKRKSEDQLNSPSVKRMQVTPSQSSIFSSGSSASSAGTPSLRTQQMSTPTGSTKLPLAKPNFPGSGRQRAYVELPTLKSILIPSTASLRTPKAEHASRASRSSDGYDTDDNMEPQSSPSKSPSKPTGDRDTRGRPLYGSFIHVLTCGIS